jgi:hypothetical protein
MGPLKWWPAGHLIKFPDLAFAGTADLIAEGVGLGR